MFGEKAGKEVAGPAGLSQWRLEERAVSRLIHTITLNECGIANVASASAKRPSMLVPGKCNLWSTVVDEPHLPRQGT